MLMLPRNDGSVECHRPALWARATLRTIALWLPHGPPVVGIATEN